MERSEILDMMGQLQLAGMRAAYDEIVSVGVKRQHGVEKVIGALLKAEIATKQARSINYQMGIANCRSPRSSPTSTSRARRSMASWSSSSRPAPSSMSRGTSC